MLKDKQVKALSIPELDGPLSLELIGRIIKARRTQEGLDTKTAAMLCNVSIVTLSKVENASKGVCMDLS